jgi:hypothetical protein
MIQDTSNILMTPAEYRLFLAWRVVDLPDAGFTKYEIYRSEDDITFTYLDEITARTTNYYGDSSVDYDQNYYYKVKAIDDDGNISFFSTTVNGKANGVQDAGEGGGGVEADPPTISNIAESKIYTTQATITWDTDELSDSTVGYTASNTVDPDKFTNEVGITTMVDEAGNYGPHSITLTGLDPDTTYYYQVISTDINGNETIENNSDLGYDFTTQAGPVIDEDSIQVTDFGNTTATITWTTDIDADSDVAYKDDTNFTTLVNHSVNSDAAYNSTNDNYVHTVNLTGLVGGVTYYFYVQSDTAIDDNSSNYYTFTTTIDTTAPIITFSPATATNLTDTTARISWETDEPALSEVHYGTISTNLDQTKSSPHYNTGHIMELTSLTPGETYYFELESTDANSNSRVDDNSTDLYTFTTTDSSDITPPVITFNQTTGITGKTDTTARISWVTDEATTSQIDYGENQLSLDQQDTNTNYNTNHSFELTGLTAETIYYFQLTNTDPSSNSTTDDNGGSMYSFTTLAEGDYSGPTISAVAVSDVTYNSATVSWVTGESGDSQVHFGISVDYNKNIGNSDESVTSHSVILDALDSLTDYYFKVTSRDADDNLTTKSTDSLTSDPDNGDPLTFTTLSPESDTDSDGQGDQLSDIMTQVQDMIDNYYFTQAEIQDALSGLYSIQITSSGPSVDITDNQVTISWTTNRPAIGKVYYWQDTDDESTATSIAENITEATTDHEVIIKNLNANTNYNYYAYSEGLLGTTTQSDNKSFSTGDTASLSGISITNLTLNSADISWTTTGSINSSTLEYGESINYNKSNKGQTDGNLHTVSLTDLKENTTYHLRVKGEDDDGQTITSDDYSFTTVSLPIISNVNIENITQETATIRWNTNVKTDSRVEFKKEGETKGTTNGNLEATTDHTFTLTNLYPGSLYSFKVSSKDTFNNESSSDEQSFTTQEDLAPPTITNVKSDTTVFPGKDAQIQTIISWTTDKDSNSVLAYRPGVEKDPLLDEQLKNKELTTIKNWKVVKKDDLTKSHLFVLTDLNPASVYQFKVLSRDKHDNVSISANFSLLTPTKQQSVLDLIIKNFEETFGWMKGIGN